MEAFVSCHWAVPYVVYRGKRNKLKEKTLCACVLQLTRARSYPAEITLLSRFPSLFSIQIDRMNRSGGKRLAKNWICFSSGNKGPVRPSKTRLRPAQVLPKNCVIWRTCEKIPKNENGNKGQANERSLSFAWGATCCQQFLLTRWDRPVVAIFCLQDEPETRDRSWRNCLTRWQDQDASWRAH